MQLEIKCLTCDFCGEDCWYAASHRGRRRSCNACRTRQAVQRRWDTKNIDRVRARKAQWVQNNLDKHRAYAATRQARKRGASGSATPEQIQARVDYYGGKCWMCGDPYEHIDHVIPLSKGGSNWPANLRPACGHCNRVKAAKTLDRVQPGSRNRHLAAA